MRETGHGAGIEPGPMCLEQSLRAALYSMSHHSIWDAVVSIAAHVVIYRLQAHVFAAHEVSWTVPSDIITYTLAETCTSHRLFVRIFPSSAALLTHSLSTHAGPRSD